MSGLGNFFINAKNYARDRKKFLEIKNDPQKSAVCVKYGVASCLLAIFGFAVSVLSFFGADSMTATGTDVLWSWIIYIPLIAVAFILPPFAFIHGTVNAVRQLRLGKKFGGVLGLLLNLASLVGAYALIFTQLQG